MKVITINPIMSLNTYFSNPSINNYLSSLPSFWIIFPHGKEHPWTKSKQNEWMNEWKSGIIKRKQERKDPKKEPKLGG